jgi:phosphoribosylanthranilate isomerase
MDMDTRIKICGLTGAEDARVAVELGADALGFIFVPDTPRYVLNFPDALHIPGLLPPFVTPVAVCKDLADAVATPLLRELPIHTVQYYGQGADPEALARILQALAGKRLIRAFRIRDERSLDEIAQELAILRPHALLLDAYHPEKLGGAGVTFNWDLAVEAKARFGLPIVLAGGLTPKNVAEAVRAVRPYAVDVGSGVEAAPGRKDHAKLRAFIQAVRAADL